jgi:hypothetical protein
VQISDAYRRARRNTSVLCGIALAWSAAQFDVNSLSVGPVGNVDLSGASVPLILACGIIYTLARCTIEFTMQPDDVRRWHLAQVDFKITVFLVRATILMLAAGGIYRSVETVAYVAVAVLLLLGVSTLLVVVGGFAIAPILCWIKPPTGSPLGRIIEAQRWSMLIVGVLLVTSLVGLGIASLRYEPLRSLWTVPPSPTAVAIFVVASIVVVISVFAQSTLYSELFAYEAPFTETKLSDGTIGVSFQKGVKNIEQKAQGQSSKGNRPV